MHYAANRPYQFEDRWINLAAVPSAADEGFEDMGPNEWLVNTVPFTTAEVAFSATNATPDIAGYLDASPDAALYTCNRTTWLDQQAVTLARLFFAPGYQMTTRL